MTFFDFFQRSKNVQERGDMYLRRVGNGKGVRHELGFYSTEKVEWVSLETDEKGNPVVILPQEEHSYQSIKSLPFSLAGKRYRNYKHFLRKQDGEWGEDAYGRKVLCTREKYPCFDSYDLMHENRYFRWYFIREGNSLSQLFVADDRNTIYITENVQNVEGWSWGRMKATGFCQPPKQD